MKKSITLKLDSELLNRVKHLAVDEDKSLSAWVSDLIVGAVNQADLYERNRDQALAALEGWSLGGRPLSRDELNGRL